jgi:hypothetical protein
LAQSHSNIILVEIEAANSGSILETSHEKEKVKCSQEQLAGKG